MMSFFFQAEDGIRDRNVTGVQTCALPISHDHRCRVGRGDEEDGEHEQQEKWRDVAQRKIQEHRKEYGLAAGRTDESFDTLLMEGYSGAAKDREGHEQNQWGGEYGHDDRITQR